MPVLTSSAAPAITAPPLATSDPDGGHAELRGRMTRLLVLRTIVISVVLGLTLWLMRAGATPPQSAVWFVSGLIAATYLVSVILGLLLRRGTLPGRVVGPQLVADLGITTLLVYVTGGGQSPYTFLYALSIVGAGAMAYRRGALIAALASITLFTLLTFAAWKQVIDLPLISAAAPWEMAGADVARSLGINVAGLVGVGALAFIFGDQLQRTSSSLASERQSMAELVNLHQDIVHSLRSGLVTTDNRGNILAVNRTASEILGVDAEACVGKVLDALLPGMSARLASEPPDSELRRADLELPRTGTALVLGISVSPLRDMREQVFGRVINFQDLTQLRVLELHMRRAERMATVGQLAAGIAHEIRNPLAAISGSIELLHQAPRVSADDRSLMTIVTREIDRLNSLINDLIDYANPRPRQYVPFDLPLLLAETARVFRQDRSYATVEVDVTAPSHLVVTADPAKLRQVVWNLMRNAADAASDRGGHVWVDATPAGDDVGIAVRDDGTGIEPENVARIFDPFFTTKQHGTGLGLAICHSVVSEHGGRIDVTSQVGVGTTMTIWIPMSPTTTGAAGLLQSAR